MAKCLFNYLACINIIASTIALPTIGSSLTTDQSKNTSPNQGLSENSLQQATELFKILKPYQLLYDIDKAGVGLRTSSTSQNATNDENIIRELAIRFQEKSPLHIVLIGFPPKSTNDQKKVLGRLPDMAERYSLLYLHDILKKIQQRYPFGATLTIISDGVVFNDVIGISDANLVAYEDALKKLGADLKGLLIITSSDLPQKGFKSLEHLRKSINQCDPTEETLQKLFKTDSKMRDSYTLMQKRISLELDHPKGQQLLKKYSLQDISRRMLERSKKFGNFLKIQSILPANTLHFCVHYQNSTSDKFGVKLSPTSAITPWHGVLVLEDKEIWHITHRQDIDPMLYLKKNIIINGVSCPYFKPIN